MLYRQRRVMLLVCIGLALSILLNVALTKWALFTDLAKLPIAGSSLLSPIALWAVAWGAFEFVIVILMICTFTSARSRGFILITKLLMYYFMVQLLACVLEIMVTGVVSLMMFHNLSRFLLIVSLLTLIVSILDLNLARDRIREARRVAKRRSLQGQVLRVHV